MLEEPVLCGVEIERVKAPEDEYFETDIVQVDKEQRRRIEE